jgi:hypothetical protein
MLLPVSTSQGPAVSPGSSLARSRPPWSRICAILARIFDQRPVRAMASAPSNSSWTTDSASRVSSRSAAVPAGGATGPACEAGRADGSKRHADPSPDPSTRPRPLASPDGLTASDLQCAQPGTAPTDPGLTGSRICMSPVAARRCPEHVTECPDRHAVPSVLPAPLARADRPIRHRSPPTSSSSVTVIAPTREKSQLAGRTNDLRFACLSGRLNVGLRSARVARWAGRGLDQSTSSAS